VFVDSLAQQMPLVYDVENTGVDCPIPYLPSFSELPTIQALPDPFMWADGRGRMSNFSDWRYRRAEISAEVQHYELGTKPPPANLQASFSNDTVKVTVEDGGKSLTLTAVIVSPSGNGPFPAVIGVGSGTGSLLADIFTSRGIATIAYNFGQVAPWTQNGRGLGGFYTLYPDPMVGYFAAWAWGVSRIIDGLEKVPQANIDLKHLAVTGCSFAGKIALYAGALDERIALTVAQEPGGGGDATWRVTETLSGSRETLRNAQSYGWYYQDVSQFNNAVTKLPFDQHEVMALIAPRALFVLGNPDYEWLADESGYVGCKAAKEVWKALGVPDRFGFSKVGGHLHCALPDIQKPEVAAFVEKFLLGDTTVNTNISTNPGYTTDLSGWITWTTPTLSNGTSFFGKASLIYPSNLQKDLDKNITFKWNKVKDAEKYFIQVSIDQTFTNDVKSDSTTTDTVKTITDLLGGKRYFWRVQVKNVAGSLGPWSDVWNFTTYIPLPTMPQLVSATPYPNRPDFVTLKWKRVQYADQYVIQLSYAQNFTALVYSDSTTDTVKSVMGLSEGRRYYWRVQAKNVAGSSPWSDSNFTIILAPTDLVLQRNALNEITLTWNDNSTVEDGYVIERKQSPQTSFTVLDTLERSGNTYVDKKAELSQTYTYRIKAYKGSAESDYSNEASLTLVGVEEEKEEIPTEYSISQNYPNPFNPTTRIKFALPKTALTKLTIYDLLGREIQILINRELEAGYHEIAVDANNLPSGVYFYGIQSGDFIQTKKLILMK
jgi:hypothetical protein